jgi:hypothetical protein
MTGRPHHTLPSRPTDNSTLTLARQSSYILRPAHIYNRYVQIANEHTAISDLLTTQCTTTDHIEYTPNDTTCISMTWTCYQFQHSHQHSYQSPILHFCSASWGWASNARNMSWLWTSIKWKSEVRIKLVVLIMKLRHDDTWSTKH